MALPVFPAHAAGSEIWTEDFEYPVRTWYLTHSPGVSATCTVVAEGWDGSQCLKLEARMVGTAAPNAYARVILPMDSRGGDGVTVDSATVVCWHWRVGDTHASDGIQVCLQGDAIVWLGSSHKIYGSEGVDFRVTEDAWQAQSVRVLSRGPHTDDPGSSAAGPTRIDTLMFEANFPRSQTAWIDNIKIGPDSLVTQVTPDEASFQKDLANLTLQHGIRPYSGAMEDIDGDGDIDLLLIGFESESPKLLVNDGTGNLDERSAEFGLEGAVSGGGAIFLDIDNDGWVDLATTAGQGEGIRVFRNVLGSEFVRVVGVWDTLSFPYEPYGVTAVDVDADGDLDLAVFGVEGGPGTPGGLTLLRNLGGLTFEDATRTVFGRRKPTGNIFGASFGDLDGDRDPDLFAGFTKTGARAFENRDGQMTSVFRLGDIYCELEGCPVADLDRDGDLDLYLPLDRDLDGRSRGANFLLENQGDMRFEDIAYSARVADSLRSEGAVIADLDNDGLLDIFVANALGENHAFHNLGSMRFADSTYEWGLYGSRYVDGAMGADLNGDGGVDIVVIDHEVGYRILWNKISRGRFLKVRLRGLRSNAGGVGSKVWLYDQGHLGSEPHLLGFHEVTAGQGFHCSGPQILHFGLGQVVSCDLRVLFPTGTVKDIQDVQAGTTVLVSEATSFLEKRLLHPVLLVTRPTMRHWFAVRSTTSQFLLLVAAGLILYLIFASWLEYPWRFIPPILLGLALTWFIAPFPESPGSAWMFSVTGATMLVGRLAGYRSYRRLFSRKPRESARLELMRELRAYHHGDWAQNIMRLGRLADLSCDVDVRPEDAPKVREWLEEARQEFETVQAARLGSISFLARSAGLPRSEVQDLERDLQAVAESLTRLTGERASLAKQREDSASLAANTRSLLGAIEAIGKRLCLHLATDLLTTVQQRIPPASRKMSDHKIALEFTNDLGEETPSVWIRTDDLAAVVDELLNNALRACQGSKECRIMVTVSADVGRACITVGDTGRGVPQELKDKIFEEGFSMVRGGSGFGLSYVRKTLDKYGGTIELGTPGDGWVTSFTVTLARAPSSPGMGSTDNL
jgi:signal transduction histidine kinase